MLTSVRLANVHFLCHARPGAHIQAKQDANDNERHAGHAVGAPAILLEIVEGTQSAVDL